LELWVINHPELLDESLFVITSEFDRFDKSDLRLDILALDRELDPDEQGVLVVIELKLDAKGSLADLQAVRYAALCSTMTMTDVVSELAVFKKITNDEATKRISNFLEMDELPALGNRPRIVLAAGSIEDQELTSTVIWLSGFGVDISCIELTPYQIPGTLQIILVPKTLIPLPEAKDYFVKVQEKEISHSQQNRDKTPYKRLWHAVADEFNKLETGFRASGRSTGQQHQIRFGDPRVHYEWLIRTRDSRLDVSLHFEKKDLRESLALLEIIKAHENEIKENIGLEFIAEPWGEKYAQVEFRLPFDGEIPSEEIAPEAALVMKTLIERTWPLIESHVNKQEEYATYH
jgi:hypothetical protein